MPLSLIVYDDAANKKGSEAFAQGDGPPRGRELEIADILRFIKTARRSEHGVADRRRALRRGALLQSGQGAVPGFRAVLGIRLRAAACRHFGPNELDNTFGPEVRFVKAPGEGQTEPAAVGRHAVLRSCRGRGRDRPHDGNAARPRRRRAVVDHSRSGIGVVFSPRPALAGEGRGEAEPVHELERELGAVPRPSPGSQERSGLSRKRGEVKKTVTSTIFQIPGAAAGVKLQHRLERFGRARF